MDNETWEQNMDINAEQSGSDSEQDMFKSFGKAMEMMRMFNNMNENSQEREMNAAQCPCGRADCPRQQPHQAEPGRRPGAPQFGTAPIYFDEHICTPELKSVKAAIPYLEPRYQRTVGIMVKLAELNRLMDSYDRPPMQGWAGYGEDWQRGMLQAFRAHMPPERRRRIDIILNAMNMMDQMNSMQAGEGVDML